MVRLLEKCNHQVAASADFQLFDSFPKWRALAVFCIDLKHKPPKHAVKVSHNAAARTTEKGVVALQGCEVGGPNGHEGACA